MTVRGEIAQSPRETGARSREAGQHHAWEFRRGCASFVGILQGGWHPCRSGRGRLQSRAHEGGRHPWTGCWPTERRARLPGRRANCVKVRRYRACEVDRAPFAW